MIFSRFTVIGDSMLPALHPGQDILVLSWFIDIKARDFVVFKWDGKRIVKRVIKVNKESVRVTGENISSMRFGLIRKREILGKVIWISNR